MKSRRYPPAYFRYFKARLWNLTRPSIWGTAIFLSIVGLTIKEYWARPDIFTNRQSKPVATQQSSPTLSPEDRANVADIDNLPVLVYDSNLGALPLEAAEPIPKTPIRSALEEAISKQKTANDIKLNVADNSAPLPKSDNPFLKQADNLLQLSNIQRNNRFLGLNASKSSNRAEGVEFPSGLNLSGLNSGQIKKNNTDKTVAVNPLQAALNSASTSQNSSNLTSSSPNLNSLQLPLNQSFNPNQTNLSNSSLNTINGFGQLQPTNTLPNQSITQPYSSRTGLTTTADGINGIPSSTGYAQPTVTNQPQTDYSNYNNGGITQPQTYYGNYNNSNLNNNFNNSQSPNTTQSIPITPPLTPTVPNYTTPYSSVPGTNQTGVPSNTTPGNNALINQGLQQSNQVQQYNYSSSPTQVPSRYPSTGQVIRY